MTGQAFVATPHHTSVLFCFVLFWSAWAASEFDLSSFSSFVGKKSLVTFKHSLVSARDASPFLFYFFPASTVVRFHDSRSAVSFLPWDLKQPSTSMILSVDPNFRARNDISVCRQGRAMNSDRYILFLILFSSNGFFSSFAKKA